MAILMLICIIKNYISDQKFTRPHFKMSYNVTY